MMMVILGVGCSTIYTQHSTEQRHFHVNYSKARPSCAGCAHELLGLMLRSASCLNVGRIPESTHIGCSEPAMSEAPHIDGEAVAENNGPMPEKRPVTGQEKLVQNLECLFGGSSKPPLRQHSDVLTALTSSRRGWGLARLG